MNRYRNYWVYSAGLVVACAISAISASIGGTARVEKVVPVFAGFVIAWISTTIARYVYPPPARWGTGAE